MENENKKKENKKGKKKGKKWEKFMESKFLLAVIMLTIGIAYTFVAIEGNDWYNWLQEGLSYTHREIVIKDVGAKVLEQSDTLARASLDGNGEGLEPAIPIKEIVAKVFRLESSGGKNDSCKAKGKFNGYGYAQNTATWNCYDSQDEVKGIVEDWFVRNLEDKTIPEALCYYNEGKVKSDCGYYQKYLEL